MIRWLLLLMLSGQALLANTYYVAKTGNNSNNGLTPGTAWLTIAKAAGVAAAGDTVNIGVGTYSESFTCANPGTAVNPITFVGASVTGVVVVGNITVSGNYVVISTLTDEAPGPIGGTVYGAQMNGTGDTFTNCLFQNMIATAAQNATVLVLAGVNDTVTRCTVWNLNDIDVFHVFGTGHLIYHCLVSNINQPSYPVNHVDFVQSWGPGDALNITIDGNMMVDCDCQAGNTETDEASPVTMSNWLIINNLFLNIGDPFFSGIPYTKFINNVFYRTDNGNGNGSIDFYQASGAGSQRSSSNDVVVNNVFLACGPNPADTTYSPLSGAGGGNLSAMQISNNYFACAGFVPKNLADIFAGVNYINGGDPKFVNTNQGFYDFHIGLGSVLIGKGLNATSLFTDDHDLKVRPATGAWDVGAYIYVAPGSPATGFPIHTRGPGP